MKNMAWLNPPPDWSISNGRLHAQSGDATDFWQGTYYGFHPDNGHFFHRTVRGDFTAFVTVEGDYRTLYDQAGLMVRLDQRHWIKCGIEFTDGAAHFSTVVTSDCSDWSAQILDGDPNPTIVRMTRMRGAIFIQYRRPGGDWRMARLASFAPDQEALMVGLAFCSPKRAGFNAQFYDFGIEDPQISGIHD